MVTAIVEMAVGGLVGWLGERRVRRGEPLTVQFFMPFMLATALGGDILFGAVTGHYEAAIWLFIPVAIFGIVCMAIGLKMAPKK